MILSLEGKAKAFKAMHDHAKQKGGKCLAEEYPGSTKKILWQCKDGHQWLANWNVIQNMGTWCPKCGGSKPPTLEEIQTWIDLNHPGGSCLSKEYKNCSTKLQWECAEGHRWEANWNLIYIHGIWCPGCSKLKFYNLEEIQEWLDLNYPGGKCLADNYKDNKTKMPWSCKEGHQWESTWYSVHNENWCKRCGPASIKGVQEWLDQNYPGGKCLSKEFIPHHGKLIFQCAEGHIWDSRWTSIKTMGNWCPECSSCKTEKVVRSILEEKLGYPFPKTKIRLPGRTFKLELDGYNEEHRIAFEYQGGQHYFYVRHFHRDEAGFQKQLQRDREKAQYCLDQGIRLLIIPYTEEKNLEEYLTQLLKAIPTDSIHPELG